MVADTLPDSTSAPVSMEDKVTAAVQLGGAVAGQFVPAEAGAVIATGVQLEPEIYHLVSALIHLFQKKPASKPAQK